MVYALTSSARRRAETERLCLLRLRWASSGPSSRKAEAVYHSLVDSTVFAEGRIHRGLSGSTRRAP